MRGGQFVHEARKRAGLTQRQLAARAGLSQPALARIESGASAPAFERVIQLVRASGFDLDVHVVPLDEDAMTLAEQSVGLSPDERLDALHAGLDIFEAGRRARGAKGEGPDA